MNRSTNRSGTDNSAERYKVSVIINTYNRWPYLRDLMKSLEKQSYPYFEVIVVNGPSTDDTFRVKELYPNVKYVEIKERNISVSRNVGIKVASGDCVVFIDDDALPCDPDWLSRFVKTFKSDQNIIAIAGPTKKKWTENYEFYRAFTGFYGKIFDIWPSSKKLEKNDQLLFETGIGTNIAIRRKELLEIGGFDEYYLYYYDENDVHCRLYSKGYKTFNLKDNFVRHFTGSSDIRGNGFDLNWSRIAKSTAYYGMKNGNDRFFIRIIKVIKVLFSDRSLEIISNYRNKEISIFSLIKYLIKYYYGGIIGVLAGIFKRRKFLPKDYVNRDYKFINLFNITD